MDLQTIAFGTSLAGRSIHNLVPISIAVMATMAAVVPATIFSTASSTSQPSSSTFHRTLPSLVHFKPSLRISASSLCNRHGHGSVDVFSGATVSCQGVPVRSDSANTRLKVCSDIEQEFSDDEICSSTASDLPCIGSAQWFSSCGEPLSGSISRHGQTRKMRSGFRCNCASRENQDTADNEDCLQSKPFDYILKLLFNQLVDSTKDVDKDSASGGVAIAVKILQFYKREISPLLPGSCRFVPTCSEYGMQAFKKYGVVKGTILTAWRLSRCNPLGGSGFDPPRWFDEPRPPPY